MTVAPSKSSSSNSASHFSKSSSSTARSEITSTVTLISFAATLLNKRRKIVAHIIYQENLTAYRKSNESKSIRELATENHHPTKMLARNLLPVGEPKPTPIHEAHHIIPGSGIHRKELIIRIRLNLHAFGIGLNDQLNGIWLRNFTKNTAYDWATPESPAHRPIHIYNYETWIASKFSNDILPERVFLSRLQTVKRELRIVQHPADILQRKTG